MNICFWTYDISSCGGVQKEVCELANSLCEYHRITLLCDIQPNTPYYLLDQRIMLEHLSHHCDCHMEKSFIARFNKKTSLLNNQLGLNSLENAYLHGEKEKIVRYFNAKDFDIIVGVHCYKSLILSMVKCDLKAIVIGWQHNSFDAIFHQKGKYLWHLDKLASVYLKKLDGYVTLTKSDKKKIDSMCEIQSIVIPNMIVHNDYESTHALMESKNIIAVGRFVYAKGFDVLIKAAEIFFKSNPDWKMFILGDGPLFCDINEKVQRCNLIDHVKLPGEVRNVSDYLKNSSIFVSSSRWEGQPLSIIEAMFAGLPIVSFDIEAMRSFGIDRCFGLTVNKQKKAKGLASALDSLAKSIDMRKRFSACSLEKAIDYTKDNIFKKWNCLFHELIICRSANFDEKIVAETKHSKLVRRGPYLIKKIKGNLNNSYSFERETKIGCHLIYSKELKVREIVSFDKNSNCIVFKYVENKNGRPQRLDKKLLSNVEKQLKLLSEIKYEENDWITYRDKCISNIHYFESKIEKSNIKSLMLNLPTTPCLIHGDVSRSNMIVGDENVTLIDFENSGLGFKKWDKAYFIASFLFDEIDDNVLKELDEIECKLVLLALQMVIGRMIKNGENYNEKLSSYLLFKNYFLTNQLYMEDI